MNNLRANARFWISGIAVAFTGVALARLLAPHCTGGTRILLAAAGQFLAMGGLFIICLGVRRRIKPTADR